ncbi:NADH-quinone oxidoreductase subunit C [Streptomyces sp. NPDC127033]|uniref:NADH-quinone oxidoreductase subunit C n=1 Tax=Streptomyces sp. NPDC127033 TaxID=3347110 RepID=UPI003647D101
MSDEQRSGNGKQRPGDDTRRSKNAGPESKNAGPTSGDAGPESGKNVPSARDRADEPIRVQRGMFGANNGGDTSGYGGLVRTVTLPGASSRPYGGPGGVFDEIADELEGALEEQDLVPSHAIEKTVVDRGELTFHVAREHLAQVARTLRDDPALRFELCTGVSGVHYPGDKGRELHAVYHLRSLTHGRLIRLEVSAPDEDPHVPSLVAVYPTNDWHERETYDFFGLIFDGHPALTRIMMPDDWQGFPQRKDYPLGGIPVEYKGAQIPAPDQRRSYS